jgi:ribosomal-protein-alanine N-acetyltransferase
MNQWIEQNNGWENSQALSDWKPPFLETSRLILRPVTLDDAPAIFSWSRKPQVTQYSGWNTYSSVQEAYQYIQHHVFQNYRKGIPEPWAITLKEDAGSLMIGSIGCFWVNEPFSMEIGYSLDDLHWGKGFAAEAAKAVLDFCFMHFPLKRIQGRCVEESGQSKSVMEKCGMQHEGLQRNIAFSKGRYWNMNVYAVTKD